MSDTEGQQAISQYSYSSDLFVISGYLHAYKFSWSQFLKSFVISEQAELFFNDKSVHHVPLEYLLCGIIYR